MTNQKQASNQLSTGSTVKAMTKKTAQPWTKNDKSQLALCLGQIFDLQKQFGKTTSQLENIISGFCWVLDGYELSLVITGIAEYAKRNSDIPTPSDIVKIIDPQPEKFKPDWNYYRTLKDLVKDGGPFAIGTDEQEYISACETYSLTNLRENQR